MLRRNLIHRGADEGFVLLHRMRAAQEHGGRAHVILGAAGVFAAPRRDRRMREVADDAHAIAERLERLQDLGELEPGPVSRRRPLVHRRAVRDVDAAHARLRRGCRLRERGGRGHHRFEQRQRQRDAGAAKERAPREVFLRDERHGAVPPSYRFI